MYKAAIFCLLFSTCSGYKPDLTTQQMMEHMGLTNIRFISGNLMMECPQYCVGSDFEATDYKGNHVTGLLCVSSVYPSMVSLNQ